ncbi:MAG: hypothetical protein ABFD51_05575, partial [Anaerolineaceae bacterium]
YSSYRLSNLKNIFSNRRGNNRYLFHIPLQANTFYGKIIAYMDASSHCVDIIDSAIPWFFWYL